MPWKSFPNRSRKPPGTAWGSFWPPGAHFGPPGALLGLSRRSREPLGSLLGPPKWLPEALPEASLAKARFSKHFGCHFGFIAGPPGPRKSRFSCGTAAFFRKSRGSKKKAPKTPKKKNLAIMEREAREAGGRATIASKARAERAARTARAGATRQRTAARREWREPPEDGDSKPVRSLMPRRAV